MKNIDLQKVENIKRLAIIAMFSDDYLMDKLVLKGGNALDIIYKIALRSSRDLDFSIEGEFKQEELKNIESKIQKILKETFNTEGYEVFDIKFIERPEKISPELVDFWGGYKIEFKIIDKNKIKIIGHKLDSLRRNSIEFDEKHKRTFEIDISKFEYCTTKRKFEIEGYTIYVYTPEMIIFEKLRAICQQMPEYAKKIKTITRSARARDFFDIYTIFEKFNIDISAKENVNLLISIFEAKKVPLGLIGEIHKYREYHRLDFTSVKDTLKPEIVSKEFDFYFDYVVQKCELLKTLWEK
jgi:predicted nucleotidyltransferase component of viral defense system